MKETTKQGGLAGVTAADSAICLCGADDHSLLYRGYSIHDLVEHASFEEVSWLLLRGTLPSPLELENYLDELSFLRELGSGLKETLENIPPTENFMDAMRSQVSLLGHLEPETLEKESFWIADRLIANLGSMLIYWYRFHLESKRISLETNEPTLAGHILHLITGRKPSKEHIDCLNASMILYAEHEFNASTFTVRVIASTLADFYSAICGGIGALSGPLHGGANEKAWNLISQFKTPDEAEEGVMQLLNKKELVMGFGHRVYTTEDPRSKVMKEWARKLSKDSDEAYLFPIAERIAKVMKEQKGLFDNVDFYSALVYHYLDIPTSFFTPLFVMSRISGWSAHLLEQRAHNKLIRPLSNYTGLNKQLWIPLDERTKSHSR